MGDYSLNVKGSNINTEELIKNNKKVADGGNQEMSTIFGTSSSKTVQNSDNMMGLSIEQGTKPQTPVKTNHSGRIDKHDPEILKNAPKADFKVAGEDKKAAIVVDLSENRLYRYNTEGEAFEVYSVASGAKSTPTHTGIRRVSHIESYPYDKAPATTKRHKNPKPYGPNILILNTIDPKTGKNIGSNGEFIHGNNNAASIGKYASGGCIRMDNDVITQLAKEVKPGSYVIIQE